MLDSEKHLMDFVVEMVEEEKITPVAGTTVATKIGVVEDKASVVLEIRAVTLVHHPSARCADELMEEAVVSLIILAATVQSNHGRRAPWDESGQRQGIEPWSAKRNSLRPERW